MTSAPVALEVRKESFESLEHEWRGLLPGHCAGSPFLTPAWLKTWWRHFGHDRELLLLSFREAGRLRGVAPLMQTGGTVTFLALSDICDYHDFLFPCGEEERFLGLLLREMSEAGWESLRFEGLREESPTLSLLPAMMEKFGLPAEVEQDEVSPHIPMAPTWETYVESLGKKDRHELRRKLRRLEGAGNVRLTTAAPATLDADVDEFITLMKDSREEKATFMTGKREGFFHDLARAMDQEGLFRLFFLELDGKRVAGAFCFDYEGAYFLYNSGFDTRQASLSVGLLLKALILKDAVERGKRGYDLLRGAEPYKYHLGAKDRWLHRVVVRKEGRTGDL